MRSIMNREQLTITLQVILSIIVAIEIQDSEYMWLIFGIISGIIAIKHEASIIGYFNKIGKYVYVSIWLQDLIDLLQIWLCAINSNKSPARDKYCFTKIKLYNTLKILSHWFQHQWNYYLKHHKHISHNLNKITNSKQWLKVNQCQHKWTLWIWNFLSLPSRRLWKKKIKDKRYG